MMKAGGYVKNSRGLLICFEGLDKSGKSTQTMSLMNALGALGIDSEVIRFPDRSTEIGEVINKYLKRQIEMPSEAIHLLFSANRWEHHELILKKMIQEHMYIITDRYAYSGVAYTGAKGKHSLEYLKRPDIGLVRPDIVFYLDVQPDQAKNRGGDYGSELYEHEEFQKKVGENFKLLKEDNWIVIDALQSKEEVAERIMEEIQKYWEAHPEIPQPGKLWSSAN